MFSLMTLLDLSEGRPGMLIPVFSSRATNVPYVQQMDEFLLVREILPFFEYENYQCLPSQHSQNDTPTIAIGDKGLIAFRSTNDQIVVGDFEEILKYIYENRELIERDPVLHLQLQRIESAELNPSYALWREVAPKIFSNDEQAKFWVDSELQLYQKQKRIWADIDPIDADNSGSGDGLAYAALNEFSTEYILRWLSNRSNFASKNWTKIWHYVHEKLPFDDRVSQIAVSWLYSLDADDGDLQQSKSIIYALLQGWVLLGKDFPDYGEFLSDRLATDPSVLFAFIRPKQLFAQLFEYLAERGNLDDVLKLISFSLAELPKENYIVHALRDALTSIGWGTGSEEEHSISSTHNRDFEQRQILLAQKLWDQLDRNYPDT